MQWRFGPYVLDLENACLWRDDHRLQVRPKTFDILVYLVEHAGELVTRDDLLEAVWPETTVADGVLATGIGELRKILGETARAPQYISTVHRRGYRFIASLTLNGSAGVTPLSCDAFDTSHTMADLHPDNHVSSSVDLIEREAELDQLHQYFAAASRGDRQIVFLAGEAGIGKTVLLDAFLNQLGAAHSRVGRGQCIDHYGAGEAYLPLLEALGQVATGQDRTRVLDVLRQHAPSWLLQLPGLLAPEAFEQLQQRSLGASRERMLRELAEAVEVLTLDRPLVLVLDDLHWSDVSTLDWLSYVARRRALARLLVIGAYRPVDAVARDHPIRAVTQELRGRGQCEELMLPYLSESGVAAYLKQVFGAASLSRQVIRSFYQRTNGNPLFVVSVVNEVARQNQNAIDDVKPLASVSVWPEAALMSTPESLRLLINQQLERLPSQEREYLEVASVVGREFSSVAVAACLEVSEEQADPPYAGLARRGQFISALDAATTLDGAMTAQYRFIHDLYYEFLYEHIPASRRARWHRKAGAWLEAEYGPRAREMAGGIAEHYVRGHSYADALPYLQYATENALQRSASQEAIQHATIGCQCLRQLPETAERDRHELRLQLTLASALVATSGFSSSEVEQAYARAHVLARRLGENPQLFIALYGLYGVYAIRAAFHDAAELSEEILSLAENQQDRTLLIGAHDVNACNLFHTGQFARAQEHAILGLKIYEPTDHQDLVALYGLDLGFYSLFWSALSLWALGYPDQSLQRIHQLLDLAQSTPHAFSLGLTHLFATHIHCLRGETRLVREQAETLISLARDHGLDALLAQGTIMQGWARAQLGQTEEGLVELHQGLEAYQATGQEMDRPFYLGLLAQAYGRQNQPEEGLRALDEALAMIASLQGYAYEAWLYQLQGDLLFTVNLNQPEAIRWPEECVQLALTTARRQQAKSLELRATISLCRMWQSQGKLQNAYDLLTPVYNWFTEGGDTLDMQEAKTLLSELER